MHNTFIFDCGNVIRSWDLMEIGLKFFSPDDVKEYMPIIRKDWEMLDMGMNELEFYENKKKVIPERLYTALYNLLFNWGDYFKPIDEMIKVIDILKKNNKKVYMLSNMPYSFINNMDKFPELKKFDGLVFSCDIKMIKPNKDIYEYILKKYNIDPKDAIFIDDLKENIDGANKASIDGFVFNKNNIDEFKAYLKEKENIIF